MALETSSETTISASSTVTVAMPRSLRSCTIVRRTTETEDGLQGTRTVREASPEALVGARCSKAGATESAVCPCLLTVLPPYRCR